MEIAMQPYEVYIKTDTGNRIININCSAHMYDTIGWTKIDEGYGDKYHHAQGNYLPGPLMDERGIFRYKIVKFVDWPEGKIIHEFFHEGEEYGIFERTQEDMDADYTPPAAALAPDGSMASLVAEVAALKESNAQLQEALDLLLSGEVESDG